MEVDICKYDLCSIQLSTEPTTTYTRGSYMVVDKKAREKVKIVDDPGIYGAIKWAHICT